VETDIGDDEKMRLLEKEFNDKFMFNITGIKHINLDNINDSHASNSLNSIEKRKMLDDLFNKKMAGELTEPTQYSTHRTGDIKEKKKDGKGERGAKGVEGEGGEGVKGDREAVVRRKKIDKLKYESKRFDKLCIRTALNGISKNKLHMLNMNIFLDNFKAYVPHNKKYKTFVMYKNQDTWYLLTKKTFSVLEYKHIKFLKICLNQFIEKDKFKKVINNTTYRCCYLVYNLEKSVSNEIELVICTKINNDEL
jgi:hypothetical protein